MAEKFVRSTRGVKDIDKLSTNLIEETDIVSTEDGKLFIKGKDGYIEVGADIDLSLYAKKSDIPEQPDLTPYATKQDLTSIEERLQALETQSTTE